MNLNRADRLECVRRLVQQGLSDGEIAVRLHCTDRTILRDRQDLDLPSPIGRSGCHDQQRTA